jgi:hypothetical protein
MPYYTVQRTLRMPQVHITLPHPLLVLGWLLMVGLLGGRRVMVQQPS